MSRYRQPLTASSAGRRVGFLSHRVPCDLVVSRLSAVDRLSGPSRERPSAPIRHRNSPIQIQCPKVTICSTERKMQQNRFALFSIYPESMPAPSGWHNSGISPTIPPPRSQMVPRPPVRPWRRAVTAYAAARRSRIVDRASSFRPRGRHGPTTDTSQRDRYRPAAKPVRSQRLGIVRRTPIVLTRGARAVRRRGPSGLSPGGARRTPRVCPTCSRVPSRGAPPKSDR